MNPRQQSGAHNLLLPLAKRADALTIHIVLLVAIIELHCKFVVPLFDDLAIVQRG
jgi:hypothetical protein